MSLAALALLGALFLGWVAWNALRLPGSFHWNAARRARREAVRIASLDTAHLVEHVRGVLRFERWERFPAAGRILTQEAWTDAELLESLKALYAEATQETPGDFGREGNLFELYDSGLVSIVEMLEARTRARRV